MLFPLVQASETPVQANHLFVSVEKNRKSGHSLKSFCFLNDEQSEMCFEREYTLMPGNIIGP